MWAFDFCNNVVRFQDWILRRKRFIPHGRASKGERAVENVLRKHCYSFETQYELGYYVHADFAVKLNDKTCIIEYDGRQHYHPIKHFGGWWRFFLQRWKDVMENAECRSRNMPILRIKYSVPMNKIEQVVIDFLNENS